MRNWLEPAPSLSPRQLGKIDWHALWGLIRPELRLLGWATLALAIASGLTLLFPQGVRVLLDAVTNGRGERVINQALLVLLAIFAVQAIFVFIRAYLFNLAGERVVARLRRDLYDALVRQEMAFFDTHRTGEFTQRLAADTELLQTLVTLNLSMVLRNTAQIFGGLAVMLYTSWRLTLLMLVVVPVVQVGVVLYGRYVRGLARETRDVLAESMEIAEESLSSIRTVRAFGREGFESDRYGERVDAALALASRRALAQGLFQGASGLFFFSAIALVLWYGGVLALQGAISLGDLTAFMLYTLFVAFGVAGWSGIYGNLMRAVGASERVFELVRRETEMPLSGGDRLPRVRGHVRFRAVNFAYPARPEAPVLRAVDLDLEPGRIVALVGPSGGGKSTIAQLIARFYDPQEGQVSLDGHGLETLDPTWLREQVGSVAQEPVLFASSIRDNIRYGCPLASDADIVAAADVANASGFVADFPRGFDTRVGERGVRLSGGQKQRIAIARAVLKNPPGLILDEATSALDAESEFLVQQALERLMEGRAVLVIAHRLSTVRAADEVLVIDQGVIVERGQHQELLERDGAYRKLVERQFATG